MKSKTRAISEGAMMLAIIGMLLIVNRQFAGTFELMMFLLSIPIVIYTVKYGLSMGVTLSVSASLMSLMFATPTSIFYLISSIVIGLVYAYGVLHEWKNKWLLFASVIGNIIVTVITVILMGAVFGYDIADEVNMISKLIPDTGWDTKQYVSIIVLISYLGIALLQAMLTHILSVQLMERLKIKTIKMKNAFELQFPRWTAIVIIACYGLYFVSNYLQLDTIVMNLIMVIYCCMLILSIVDGCLTILCYFRLRGKGKGMIFLVMISCFLPILNNVISLIGVFDIWEQYRRKMKEGVLNEIHRTN